MFPLIRVTNAEDRLFQVRPEYARMKYRERLTSEKLKRFACRAGTGRPTQLPQAASATFRPLSGMARRPAQITWSATSLRRSIVQNYIKERAVDLQSAVFPSGIVNKAQFPEPVHEKTHPRTGSADHLREGFLTDLGNHGLGNSFLSKMSQHKKDTGQSLFTGIKQLVDQVLFIADVARQQIGDEHIGKCVFPMKRFHHGLLFNSQYRAIGHCRCRAHAKGLSGKGAFAEKTLVTQYADGCFFASFGDNREFYFSRLQIENRICRISLRENGPLFRKEHSFPTLTNCGKECLGVEFAAFLGNCAGTHRL